MTGASLRLGPGNKHAPNYIKELTKFKKPGKYNLRSNSDNLLLEVEKVKTYTTLGDRACQVAALAC